MKLKIVPFLSFLMLVVAALAPLALGARPAAAEGPVVAGDPDGAGMLTLLHNNDGESSLLPIVYTVEPGSGYPNTDTVSLPIGSVAAFKTLTDQEIEDARASGHAVMNVYAGDSFLASATLACSLPPNPAETPIYDAVAQKQIPYDAHIIGNHELDYSPDFFERFVRAFEEGGMLTQPFLSSNLDFSQEAGFDDLIDADGVIVGEVTDGRVIARSAILTDEVTGQRFGLVGATTWTLPTISSPRDVIVTSSNVTETAAVAQGAIDQLYDDFGVRKIIFVSHLQDVSNDEDLVGRLRRVDVAVAGGGDELLVNPDVSEELQLLPGEGAPIAGEYPLEVPDADGRTVYIVTTAGNYKYLGRLDVMFDAAGEVSMFHSADSYPRRVIPESPEATALELMDAVPMDPGIVSSVNEPVEACLDSFANTPVVYSEVTLDVSRAGVRGMETNAGNLIADSFQYVYSEYADDSGLPAPSFDNPVISVQNGGGIRQNAGDILPVGGAPGIITRLDTLNVLPFSNFMTAVEEVTPVDMKGILEHSADSLPGQGGQFLQIAGFRVLYNYAQPIGSRVISATLDDGRPLILEGEIVPSAPVVTLVTNNFTASGGDGYPQLADNPNQTRLIDDEGIALTYEGAWLEYLLTLPVDEGVGLPTIPNDPVAYPEYQPGGEGRITIIQEATAVTLATLGAGQAPIAPMLLALAGGLIAAVGVLTVRRRRAA